MIENLYLNMKFIDNIEIRPTAIHHTYEWSLDHATKIKFTYVSQASNNFTRVQHLGMRIEIGHLFLKLNI